MKFTIISITFFCVFLEHFGGRIVRSGSAFPLAQGRMKEVIFQIHTQDVKIENFRHIS